MNGFSPRQTDGLPSTRSEQSAARRRLIASIAAFSILTACVTNSKSKRSADAALETSRQPSHAPARNSTPAPTGETATRTQPGVQQPADAVQLPSGWQNLFDGKTLTGWKITEFGGRGEVAVKDGLLTIHMGAMLTGVSWTNPLPKADYEVELDALKVDGGDFFCGLTFPVGDSFCSLIVGGWGGGVVGLSSIDGQDASENETTKYMPFDKNRWYHIRLRVTKAKIEAWIDNDKLLDQSIVDRRVSLRPGEIELSAPFGLATWQTTAALRNLRIRNVLTASPEPK